MAEDEFGGFYGSAESGHVFSSNALRLDLYRLQCIFEASQPMALKCIDSLGCPTRVMLDDHEEEEITRLMISTSIFGRMLDDRFTLIKSRGRFEHNEKWFEWLQAPVGELLPDLPNEIEEPLNLREAFNKVLHANKMNFDVEVGATPSNRYLRPYLYLYGTKGRKGWRATINVYQFVEKLYNLSVHVGY